MTKANNTITNWVSWKKFYEDASIDEIDNIVPFPPIPLMQITTGLTDYDDFRKHGIQILSAIEETSPKKIEEFDTILDYGCGCGRLARLFFKHPGKISGFDIDKSLIKWMNKEMTFMKVVSRNPHKKLPYPDESFDCIISVSIFSHLCEEDQNFYLGELLRITKPGGNLFLSIHGQRAFERTTKEEAIFEMLGIGNEFFKQAAVNFTNDQYGFILQSNGHLSTKNYNYGITFIPDQYIKNEWVKYFSDIVIHNGIIHDFQSIVVCTK